MKTPLIRLSLACIAAVLVFGSQAQAQGNQPVPYQEGIHYFLIEGAPGVSDGTSKLEEAFSYLCTHCNTFDPYVEAWKNRKPDNVEFRRIPVGFGRASWELYARGYVTAELMNVSDEAHGALMDLIWKEKKMIRDMEGLAEFYSQFGVDKEKFISTSRSFAVDGKMRKDQSLIQTYGIRGTPSMVVNGRYRIAGSEAVASYDVMFDIVDYLIELDASSSQTSSAAAD